VVSGLSAPLAPQTLYFLAVRCNGSVTLSAATTGGASAPLVGAPDMLSTSIQITAPSTFGSGALPLTFTAGGTITAVGGAVPNVYAGP
jgi:hypothetical protein